MRPPSRVRGGLLAAVLAALLAVTGCSGGGVDPVGSASSGDPQDTAVTGIRAPSTEAGGTLRVVAGQIDNLDPARSYTPWVWNLMRLYTRTLVTYASAPGAAGAELVPDLATDLGVASENNTVWTYTLRPGTRFENGRPITSTDLKYGIERSFASDVIVGGPLYVVSLLDNAEIPYPGPYLDPQQDNVGLTSIQTPDPSTIVFRLNRPYAAFGEVLALPSSGPVPAEADTGAEYGDAPMSSGPYRLTAADATTGLVFDRNEEWDPATDDVRTALPDRVEVRDGMMPLERDQRVFSGSADLDLTGGISPEDLSRVRDDPAVAARADRLSVGAMRLLSMSATVAPFDNPACRRAVAAAVDIAAVAEALGGETYAQPAEVLLPSVVPGGPAAPTQARPVDADAVGSELAACGRPDGFSTTIAAPNQPRTLALAESLRADLARVGIDAQVSGLDPATYYADVGLPETVAANGYGVVLTRWSPDFLDAASFLGPLVDGREIRSAGNTNPAELNDPTVNGLIDQAYAAQDPSVATAAYQEIDRIVRASASYVPLVEEYTVLVSGERVRNGIAHRAYGGYDLAVLGVR